jgi:RNA polymerase sigma-70 factor (ECF subfamily)
VNDVAPRERLAGFYAAHWPGLWAFVRRMGCDAATAQDVAQDAFAKWALSPAPAWEEKRAKAYLYAIAARGLIDQRRRRGRESPLDEERTEEAPEAPDRLLPTAWSNLTARERQLLWLAYAEGFSHEEIAKVAGLRPASVRVLLSRARERARAILTGKEG